MQTRPVVVNRRDFSKAVRPAAGARRSGLERASELDDAAASKVGGELVAQSRLRPRSASRPRRGRWGLGRTRCGTRCY